ncbi:MAG: endonuclease/exonuclease/phosphatase family protein [Turicibacter sp.]
MKLLTLNCHAWQEANQSEKIRQLAYTIKQNAYDIICLQEVSQLIDKDNSSDKVKKDNYVVVLLNELLKIGVSDYQFYWDFAHIGFDTYEEGLAILTKYEIKEVMSHFITTGTDTTNYKTRKVVGLQLNVENQLVDVYSCHTGWWEDQDEPFTIQIDNLVNVLNKDHINIVMGDFNNSAFIREEGYDYLIQKGFIDTYDLAMNKDSGVTVGGKIDGWEENKEALRLDLILVDQPVSVKSLNVIFNGVNKAVVSDHFGVEVELEVQ